MQGEILAIGNELVSGRVINTTSALAARRLFAAGHEVLHLQTVGDSPERIAEALGRALGRADFVLVTGGLGATSDDITSAVAAEALARPVTQHPEILERLRRHLGLQPDGDPGMLGRLAWLPRGAEQLDREARMAGYLLVHDEVPVFFLPGVPPQMEHLLEQQVLPRLAGWDRNSPGVRQRLFRLWGVNENTVNQALRPIEESEPGWRIGYYPVGAEVQVSLSVHASAPEGLDEEFARACTLITTALKGWLYGLDDDSMASVSGALLRQRGWRCLTAESCTGGLIAGRITAVPGSSDWFAGGVVAYSNELKQRLLGVPDELLATHGAVSLPVAAAMARGALRTGCGDIALAVTGIAGPAGGSPEKPVGTVCFALATLERVVLEQRLSFAGNRWQVQEQAAQSGLNLLRKYLMTENR
ncbi:MAG: hypothetical protein BWK76_18665 [Desulfobulbaceae bacterium A2]|nr:MAG: hypothetical protein BWK76_18665 [Desulfobulbaceae bacterium A2]